MVYPLTSMAAIRQWWVAPDCRLAIAPVRHNIRTVGGSLSITSWPCSRLLQVIGGTQQVRTYNATCFYYTGSCFPVQRHPSHFLPRLHVLPDYSRRRRNTTRSVSTLSGISTESVFSSYGVKHQGRLFSLGFPAYFLYSGECPVAGPAPCYVLAGARPDNRLQGQLPSN